MKILKYILFICIALLISACSTKTESQWVKSCDDILLWMPMSDSTKIFSWEGEIIDNIANGNGTLSYIDKNGEKGSYDVNMFYGTSSIEEIVMLDDGSKYVGAIVDGKMEGFGILAKNNELYIGTFHDSKPDGFLKLYKNKKIFYEGNWKAGTFNGNGTLYKDNGIVKTGEWINGELSQTLIDTQLPEGHYLGYVKDGKPDGLGHFSYIDGSTYKGKWKNGTWEGEGLYVCNRDSVYGIWKDGKVCGDVVYRTPNLYFEGTFLENSPIGVGNLTQKDGSYYSGYWLDGERDGLGDMIFSNGDFYTGEWEKNVFHGFGTYEYYKEKAKYQGEWIEGLQNGIGLYESPEFSYNGEWDKGWMDGDGTLMFSNEDIYQGTIHENIIDGIGCYTFANGNFYEGEFVKGKMNGLGIFQFKNGDRFEGEFVDGKIYGDGTMYLVGKDTVAITGFWPQDGTFPTEASLLFANGDLYEGPLLNGFPTQDGMWISGEDRRQNIDKANNSITHKANELYKKHRETINWCLAGASAVVTAVEVACASSVVGAPVAAVAHAVNIGINIVDASLAITSAGLDVMENIQLGEDDTEAIQNLSLEVALNVGFVLVPKVVKATIKPLKTGVKNIIRSPAAEQILKILKGEKNIIKQSALKFTKGKIFGKYIRVSLATTGRKIEKVLVSNSITQKPMIALGRLLTKFENQTVPYSLYVKYLKSNPSLKSSLKLSAKGSSKNLGDNMRLFGTDKWVKRSERIRRYLGMPKRQIEPHHIIPSNPTTEVGRKARDIWVKYFESVDNPNNGMWLGRTNKELGYKALAKGSNHSPNSVEYEQKVATAILETFKKYQRKYANDPEKMQQVLAETVDNIKKQIYKGELAIGGNSHTVHTVSSIFSEKSISSVVSDAALGILQPIM